jgi:hypothetical protein
VNPGSTPVSWLNFWSDSKAVSASGSNTISAKSAVAGALST